MYIYLPFEDLFGQVETPMLETIPDTEIKKKSSLVRDVISVVVL